MSQLSLSPEEPPGNIRNRIYLLYFLFAVIFFILFFLLICLNLVLLYGLGKESDKRKEYLDHYGRHWLSVVIVLLTTVTLCFSFVIILFSLYLLKSRNLFRKKKRTDNKRSDKTKSRKKYYDEQTSFTTTTISQQPGTSKPDSSFTATQNLNLKPKCETKYFADNINLERTITFH